MKQPLTIWAPRAKSVSILVGETRIAAQSLGDGAWQGPALEAGAEYAIAVDDGAWVPDPRSRYQPHGVHGRSQAIDASALARARTHVHVPVPLRDALIYELHVGTFTPGGTYASAIERLPELAALGVTHVELLPVAQFSGHHGWGYDGVDLFAPHAPYGTPAELARLVDSCHAHGMAAILDVVHNHFGPEGAYHDLFGPYRTENHRTPWGAAINLDDQGSEHVRRFLIDSALQWLGDYGFDGLRLDALHSLVDTSDRHFVAQLVDEVQGLARDQGRTLQLIGEFDDHDPAAVVERERGGWGLTAHWNDDFHHAVHALVTGERTGYYADFAPTDTIAHVLERGYVLDGRYSPHRKAVHGKPYGDLPRDRLVGYIQSHDQVGNRPRGERFHHLVGEARTKIAAALLFVSPFAPMIFQGEEWAASTPFLYFARPESAELRAAIREGRQREHGGEGWDAAPDPTEPAARDASVLRWDERTGGTHADMLRWYRALIEARRTYPELRDARPRATKVTNVVDFESSFTVERGALSLVVNLAPSAMPLDRGEVLLASHDGTTNAQLAPQSCALVRR